MRIAFVADVHGNLPALEAVAADIAKNDVQSTVCLGDVATIGLQPKETLERLQFLNCAFIMGNHDYALLHPSKAKELCIAEEIWPSLSWTLDRISKDDLKLIRTFRDTIALQDDSGKGILCYHGTPQCNAVGIYPTTSGAEIELAIKGVKEQLLVGGHTHEHMIRDHGGRTLLNPGSVGGAFDVSPRTGTEVRLSPWAEYGIVELNDKGISIEMKRVVFDTEKTTTTAAGSDSPLRNWWKDQYRVHP